jgi:hypothetical protein
VAQRRPPYSAVAQATAKAWRTETQVALRRGTMRAGSSPTLRAAAEAWLEGVQSGAIRNRSGHRYKPSAVRGYEAALVSRVLPALGAERLADIRRIGDDHVRPLRPPDARERS